MAPEPDVAAELERALARRVHLLAVALVGSSCLMYLAWLLTRPPSNAAFAVAAVSGFGLLCALGSLAWARRSGGHASATAGMCWLVFTAVSALAVAQGGIAGSAVWWLPLGPVLALQGGALRSGAAMAVVMVAEMVLLQVLRSRGWMPPLAPSGDTQRFIAATVSGSCMVVVVGLGLHWRRHVLRELQAALAAARDASAVKSRFLANMSHEIRTPLHGIVGASELLRGTRLDEGQRQMLSVLRRSSAALLALVDDVLDFSKLGAGRMRVAHERFDLHDAIHDAAEVFSAQAEAKGVDLLSHCTADLPLTTVGDAARLRQILHNLVGNAVKFTERGEVRVFAAPEPGADGGPWVRVSVRDSGIGMDEAQLAGLFQAFAQADLSTTRRFGGTGLGLAIARELATLLGGRIEVQSQPGQGSTFMLLLPLVDSVAAPAPQPLLHDVEVRVASASRSRREDLADLVRRHGGRCSSFEALPEPNASMPAGQPRVLLHHGRPHFGSQSGKACAIESRIMEVQCVGQRAVAGKQIHVGKRRALVEYRVCGSTHGLPFAHARVVDGSPATRTWRTCARLQVAEHPVIGPRVEALDLSSNPLTTQALDVLLTAEAFPRLKRLDLSHTGLPADGLAEVLPRLRLPALESLRLAGTEAADRFGEVLSLK